eukprot:TRINITY_DN7119_c0_g1_i1.p1 TRINITY_DN7119_c0_g1~~TRINITY_DN7119_c0_g1_i1.p1  ORF type:complete len:226 (-),score=48.05 TRINITY_DN7119_c0_g1_i1:258-935(-)
MASSKSVCFNLAEDVTHYEVEEDVEDDFDMSNPWDAFEENDATDMDWSPRDSFDSTLSDIVAAVNRAKQLRASVEEDLKRSWKAEAEAQRGCAAGAAKPGEPARSAQGTTSLIGQFWRRLGARSTLGACRKHGKSAQTKNVHGRRRWGSIELLQGKHHFKSSKAEEDTWTRSLCGAGPSNSQASAATDPLGAASGSASDTLPPSPQSRHKRLFWLRSRVCPADPL